MNSIKQIIEQLAPNLADETNEVFEKVFQNTLVKGLAIENNISKEKMLPFLNLIIQYIEENDNCKRCKSIKDCSNLLEGHYSTLEYNNEQFTTFLKKCDKQINKEKTEYKNKLFKGQYIPGELLVASFDNFETTQGRKNALTALLMFCNNYKRGDNHKGIYLYGPLGVGKSYMMVALAKKMADRDIPTLMVYVPDFFREMKQSIGDNSLGEKMEVLKKIEVLILDDIGAETISQWERDEILGAILQARMVRGIPTLYTSNSNYNDLEEHLSYSNKGGEEKLKAQRIMERIRYYSDEYFVDGPNRRKLK